MNAGDVGVAIEFDVLEDVSDGTDFEIRVRHDGTRQRKSFTAALKGGSTQIVRYVTDAAAAAWFSSQGNGDYQVQAYVVQPSMTRTSDLATMTVGEAI